MLAKTTCEAGVEVSGEFMSMAPSLVTDRAAELVSTLSAIVQLCDCECGIVRKSPSTGTIPLYPELSELDGNCSQAACEMMYYTARNERAV